MQAKRDQNRVTTLIGVSSLDMATPTNIAVDPATGEVLVQSDQTKIKETDPIDATKTNASLILEYTGDNLTMISKVIGADTYSKTFTYDGTKLTNISAWELIT